MTILTCRFTYSSQRHQWLHLKCKNNTEGKSVRRKKKVDKMDGWIKLVLLSVNVEDTMVFVALCWPSAGYTLQVIVCLGGNGILQLLGRLTDKVLPQSVNFTFSITFSGTLSVIGVDMKPGSTQLHRIPNLKGGRKGNELQICFYRVHLLTCWAPLQLSWLKPPLQL